MAATYDTIQMQVLAAQAMVAGPGSLRAAALYLTTRFREAHIVMAIMGGYSVIIRGSSRRTHDVDIAIGSNMGALRQALVGGQR
jgi:hypothetical protein